jgi:hypothetical protein
MVSADFKPACISYKALWPAAPNSKQSFPTRSEQGRLQQTRPLPCSVYLDKKRLRISKESQALFGSFLERLVMKLPLRPGAHPQLPNSNARIRLHTDGPPASSLPGPQSK